MNPYKKASEEEMGIKSIRNDWKERKKTSGHWGFCEKPTRETIQSLALIKLMPKRRYICPELIYMLTTRCLNNIIDTFMRGYSSLALTSPSSVTKKKKKKKRKKEKRKRKKEIRNTKEEINKIVCHCDYYAKNFDSTLLTFVHIFDGFFSFIVYHLKRRKRKILKKLLVKFPRHVYVDIKKKKKLDAVNVIELWSDCCYS